MTSPHGAPFDVNRVENLVTEALNAIISVASSFSPAISLPSRQIAGAGLIPYDCAMVFASVQTVTTGAPEGKNLPGTATYPTTGSGANFTLYQAVILLGIVRDSQEKMTGLGQQAPAPAAYLANLGIASQDMAILLGAIGQIADAQISATPETLTAGSPQGVLVATTARIAVLV